MVNERSVRVTGKATWLLSALIDHVSLQPKQSLFIGLYIYRQQAGVLCDWNLFDGWWLVVQVNMLQSTV